MQDTRLQTDLLKRTSFFGEVETRSEFIKAPEEFAPERFKHCNVAGFSMELDRLDDGESPKRKNRVGVRECRTVLE